MDSGRWERVKELFESALPLEPDARREFVAQHAHDDESVGSEVLSLLAAYQDAGGFMERRDGDLSSTGSYPAEPALTFSPNELIAERFRVVRFIRHGGMGEVYEAEDLELNEHVALKTIRSKVASDPHTLARFRQEVQLARRVAHPNVCRMYDVERHQPEDSRKPEVVFLTMELLEGETLADRLRRKSKMSSEEALPLVRQMAEGLAAAHEAGVLHCDFKPSNVILAGKRYIQEQADGSVETSEGNGDSSTGSLSPRAVVTDFGLARALLPAAGRGATEKSAKADGWEGTLPYMSPEQLEGRECTPATDIYALGLVIYEMLTGQRAFPDARTWEEACKRLTEPPASPRVHLADLDRRWEGAILRCLEINAALRFQSARELVQALELRPASPRNIFIPIAALAVVLAGVASVGLKDGRLRTAPIRLAVLPLENLSGNPEQDFFAEGMTDELITDLAKISALRVISRSSVIKFRGSHKLPSEIARELKVDVLVEGTVSYSGDQVRISAELMNPHTGETIWAQRYQGNLREVLGLQSEVATNIADQIRVKLTRQEHARLAAKPVNTDAFLDYLHGREAWNKGTEQDWLQARDYFEKAAQIDPDYAPAYAGLADYYWATDRVPPEIKIPRAKEYAVKAVEADPNLADAYVSLGVVRSSADWDWSQAERDFKHALQLNPSDVGAHRMYSSFLSSMGRVAEALEESRTAEKLDPVLVEARLGAGWAFYYAGSYDKALAECGAVISVEADLATAHDCAGLSLLAMGKYDQAIAESGKAVRISDNDIDRAVGLARAYALSGHQREARLMLKQWSARGTYVPPSLFAQVYVALGENQQALAWLEKAYADRDVYLARLQVEPAFNSIRSEPAFQALMDRLKFPRPAEAGHSSSSSLGPARERTRSRSP